MLVGVLVAGCGGTSAAMSHRLQLTALYVVDHNGAQPTGAAALTAYAGPFEKILAGCKTNANDLTNLAMQLSEKASAVGGRNVTNLQMLEAIALRIVWSPAHPHGCGYIYNLEEANMETGQP
jgi:hypothetical protein